MTRGRVLATMTTTTSEPKMPIRSMTQAGNFDDRHQTSSCLQFYPTCSRLLSLVSEGGNVCARHLAPLQCILLSLYSPMTYAQTGNLNKFAFIQVRDHIHRKVRVYELFEHDSHLSALASDGNGATSPDVYASSMDTIVSTGKRKTLIYCFNVQRRLLTIFTLIECTYPAQPTTLSIANYSAFPSY